MKWDPYHVPRDVDPRTIEGLAALIVRFLNDDKWRWNGTGFYHRASFMITHRGTARARLYRMPKYRHYRYVCHLVCEFPDRRVETVRFTTKQPAVGEAVELLRHLLQECIEDDANTRASGSLL